MAVVLPAPFGPIRPARVTTGSWCVCAISRLLSSVMAQMLDGRGGGVVGPGTAPGARPRSQARRPEYSHGRTPGAVGRSTAPPARCPTLVPMRARLDVRGVDVVAALVVAAI